MPTETVYGLAGNAYKENIIKKIFKIKKRPKCKPIIIHDHSIESIKKYVKEFPEKALKLAKHFWPGPLTILLKKKINYTWCHNWRITLYRSKNTKS